MKPETENKLSWIVAILVITIISVLTMMVISAEANRCGNTNYYLGEFKVNTAISLTQTCDNSSYSNMTAIKYPNGTYKTMNELMTKSGDNYNYTFSDTSQMGCYTYTISCDVGGISTPDNTDFQITSSGFIGTLGFYILILILSAGVIILGFSKDDGVLVILGSFGLYFVGIYTLFFGIDGMKDPVYTWGFGLIVLCIAFYLSVRSAWEMIVD